jgi:AraC-like DNA-binding protein
MSVRALQRRLEACGTSFRSLLAECRDDFARYLLTTTGWSIAMIASELGYTDASNFARAFGRHHGMSPAAFRRLASLS